MRYVALITDDKVSSVTDITYDDMARMQDIITGDASSKFSTLRRCQGTITQYVALAKTFKEFSSVKICIFWSDRHDNEIKDLVSQDTSLLMAEINRYNLTIFKNGVPDTGEINRQLYLQEIQDDYMS